MEKATAATGKAAAFSAELGTLWLIMIPGSSLGALAGSVG
jgi:hypothetical protein